MNQELFDKGLKVRREVLGGEYVDNALKAPTTSAVRCRSW